MQYEHKQHHRLSQPNPAEEREVGKAIVKGEEVVDTVAVMDVCNYKVGDMEGERMGEGQGVSLTPAETSSFIWSARHEIGPLVPETYKGASSSHSGWVQYPQGKIISTT